MWSAKFGWYVFCSFIVSALLCVAETNVQPHRVNAYQVSVKSNYFTFGVGNGTAWQYIRLGTDPTNFTVQDAFNWIDSNWVNVVGALMNTNDWVLLKPTNTTVQAVFNWIDANMGTNALNALQGSNMYHSITSNFIRNQAQSSNIGPQQVTRSNIAANAVLSSNIVDGTITADDLADNSVNASELAFDASYLIVSGQTFVASTFNFVNVGSTQRTLVATTLMANASHVMSHYYIDETSVDVSSGDKIYCADIGVQFSANGTSFSNEQRSTAEILRMNSYGADQFSSKPGQLNFTVPAGHYYWVYARAQSTNLATDTAWSMSYQVTSPTR